MRTAAKGLGLLLAGAIALLVLALAGGALLAALGLSNPFGSRTIDRSQPPILKSIQELRQYHAAVGNFEVVLDVEKDVKWVPDFIAGERSLFVAAGTVDAYVDFSGLAKGDLKLSADHKSVQIHLPEAQLSKPSIDQDRSYLFSQDRGLIERAQAAMKAEDQSDLYRLAVKKLASAADASDLTQQATANTKAMLTGMFNALDIAATFVDATTSR